MSSYLLTMQGKDGIRIWVHDGQYRIQRKREPIQDRYGTLQEVWESHTENGQVLFFPTWQEAEKYIRENNIVS